MPNLAHSSGMIGNLPQGRPNTPSTDDDVALGIEKGEVHRNAYCSSVTRIRRRNNGKQSRTSSNDDQICCPLGSPSKCGFTVTRGLGGSCMMTRFVPPTQYIPRYSNTATRSTRLCFSCVYTMSIATSRKWRRVLPQTTGAQEEKNPKLSQWSSPAVPDSGWCSSNILLGAGMVLFQRSTRRIVVIYESNKDDWFCPRGRKDLGESLEAAALREAYEEVSHTSRNCFERLKGISQA